MSSLVHQDGQAKLACANDRNHEDDQPRLPDRGGHGEADHGPAMRDEGKSHPGGPARDMRPFFMGEYIKRTDASCSGHERKIALPYYDINAVAGAGRCDQISAATRNPATRTAPDQTFDLNTASGSRVDVWRSWKACQTPCAMNAMAVSPPMRSAPTDIAASAMIAPAER